MSNGYERVAADYMAARSGTGKPIIEKWAASLPDNADVLDIGAGHGWPITPILLKAGLKVSAIDASPSLVAAYQKSFPNTPIIYEAVEESDFFGKTFDAILSIGLIFLLPQDVQKQVISKIASALKPKGSFLFSAPTEIGAWKDILTGETSYSLGEESYNAALTECGLSVCATHKDTGGSHYYEAVKLS